MFRKIIDHFKQLDKLSFKIMKHGLDFCFGLCIIASLILLIYGLSFPLPSMYYIGIHLFKLSLIFGIEFVVCGFVVDGIKKQLI